MSYMTFFVDSLFRVLRLLFFGESVFFGLLVVAGIAVVLAYMIREVLS